MSAPDPLAAARAVAAPITDFGAAWMLAPETFGPAIEAGFAGLDFYFCGRGGVLGEVDADLVIAAMGFMEPNGVRAMWDAGRAVMAVADAVTLFAEACARYGRDHLARHGGPDELAELADLAGRVAAAVHPAGLPLFAGWRLVPVPADPPAAAAHQLNVLRELRGSIHLAAVVANGLTPLEAVLVKGGRGTARFFGYDRDALPEVTDDHRARWERAEAQTDEVTSAPFGVLDAGDRARLVSLVDRVLPRPT